MASTPAGNLNSESKRILLEEWKECRRAVRAFDSTVTHIRSYSVLVTIALLALGGFFAITEPPLRGFVIEVLALVFLGGEFLLEGHYRGYLHAAVNRATAIERIIVPPESPQVFLKRNEVPAEAMSTKAMISEVISVQRERVYSFPVAEAPYFLYIILFGVDVILMVLTLNQAGSSISFSVPLPIALAIVSVAAWAYFFFRIAKGYFSKRRYKPPIIEDQALLNAVPSPRMNPVTTATTPTTSDEAA